MKEGTTKASAKQAVEEIFEEEVGSVDDELAERVLDADLLSKVFETAWRYQFEENRKKFRRQIENLVSDRIEKELLEDEENET